MIEEFREGINVDSEFAKRKRKRSTSRSQTMKSEVSIDESDVQPASMSMDSKGIAENEGNPSNIATEKRKIGLGNVPCSWADVDDIPSVKDSYLPSDVEEAKKTFMGYAQI